MKEKLVAIGEVEWEALGGLSHLQFRLYMVLRWFMDRQSGTVGLVGRISYQKLRENLEVHRIPGRRSDMAGAPTLQEMRSALSGLVNAGLLEPHGSGDLLVFLLPKRVRISARSKEQQQISNRGQQHDQQHEQGQEPQGFQHQQQHEQQQGSNPEQQHTSGVKVNPSVNPTGFQREGAQSAKQAKRGSRISGEWHLPEEWRAWTEENRPDLDVDQVADAFRDYWLSKAGQGGVKADWFAAWRNWCRREKRSSERGYQDRVARQMESLFPNGQTGRVIDIKGVRHG